MHVYVMAKICSSVEIQFWSWSAIRSSAEAVFHQYHLGCGEAASLCPGAEERQHGICLLFQRDFSCSMCPCRTILVGMLKHRLLRCIFSLEALADLLTWAVLTGNVTEQLSLCWCTTDPTQTFKMFSSQQGQVGEPAANIQPLLVAEAGTHKGLMLMLSPEQRLSRIRNVKVWKTCRTAWIDLATAL